MVKAEFASQNKIKDQDVWKFVRISTICLVVQTRSCVFFSSNSMLFASLFSFIPFFDNWNTLFDVSSIFVS